MSIRALVCVALACGACSVAPPPKGPPQDAKCADADALRDASFDVLADAYGGAFEVGNHYNEIEAWAATLPKGCVRDRYLEWASYFRGAALRQRADDDIKSRASRIRESLPVPTTRLGD